MLNYDAIIARLFVGTCPTSDADVQQLQQIGVDAVLCLQSAQDFIARQIDWPSLQQAYRARGITPHHIPITDFDQHDLVQHLPRAVACLAALHAAGQCVYLHCNAGVERAPTTAVAYLAWSRGLGLEKALHQVTSQRNCNPYADALRSIAPLFDNPPVA